MKLRSCYVIPNCLLIILSFPVLTNSAACNLYQLDSWKVSAGWGPLPSFLVLNTYQAQYTCLLDKPVKREGGKIS